MNSLQFFPDSCWIPTSTRSGTAGGVQEKVPPSWSSSKSRSVKLTPRKCWDFWGKYGDFPGFCWGIWLIWWLKHWRIGIFWEKWFVSWNFMVKKMERQWEDDGKFTIKYVILMGFHHKKMGFYGEIYRHDFMGTSLEHDRKFKIKWVDVFHGIFMEFHGIVMVWNGDITMKNADLLAFGGDLTRSESSMISTYVLRYQWEYLGRYVATLELWPAKKVLSLFENGVYPRMIIFNGTR